MLYLSEVVNSHVVSHTFQFCVVTTGMLVRLKKKKADLLLSL